MNKRMLEQAFTAPENTPSEVRVKWGKLAEVFRGDVQSGLSAVLAEISTNDEVRSRIITKIQEYAIQKAAFELAESTTIQSLSPDLLTKLLNIPADELRHLTRASEMLQRIGMTASEENAVNILNQSTVAAVMEADRKKDEMDEDEDDKMISEGDPDSYGR